MKGKKKTNYCGLGTKFRYWSITEKAQNGGKDCEVEEGKVDSDECPSQESCVKGKINRSYYYEWNLYTFLLFKLSNLLASRLPGDMGYMD